MVRASGERYDRQIGALSGAQRTHLRVESQGAGRLDRRELERIGCAQERLGAPLAGPGRVDGCAELLEQVERRRRGGRVRAEPRRERRRREASSAARRRSPSSAFERGQCATRHVAVAASSAISAASTSTQWAQRSSGRAPARAPRRGPLARAAGRGAAMSSSGPRPWRSHSVSFALSARCVADRHAEREAAPVGVERAGVRRVRRDPDPDERRLLDPLRVLGPLPAPRPPGRRRRPRDRRRAQPERRRRGRSRPARSCSPRRS